MRYELLTNKNVNLYIDYLKQALTEEPEKMMIDSIDENEIIDRINDEFYKNTKSILAILNNKVVGRIEYHFYGCVQDGFKMAYVDWVYVLKEHRNNGIAKNLFARFEDDCKQNGINQYFLIRSTNESTNHFYKGFKEVELKESPTLRKNIYSK